jgi:hypothetical protein
VFKQQTSGNESRSAAISRSAQEIITRDAVLRKQNTDRLRAARLARDAAIEPEPEAAPKAPRKKAAATRPGVRRAVTSRGG